MNGMKFKAPVIHGRHLGASLGVPTINQLPPDSFSELPRGVYFSRVTLGGVAYPAVSNLGTKPTVDERGALLCETHILGLTRDLYGQELETELLFFSRPEQKFSSVEELSRALHGDVAAAKEYFKL